jgi:hypothetical protein
MVSKLVLVLCVCSATAIFFFVDRSLALDTATSIYVFNSFVPFLLLRSFSAFDELENAPQNFLLLPQRLEYALELVDAIAEGRSFATHLSGPNGVGKSAILLLAFIICTARSLPVAYIARSESWVKSAMISKDGDVFFLKTFWRQNADLVVASPALRKCFAAALTDGREPFNGYVMQVLQDTASVPGGPRVGVLIDEVQHITTVVRASKKPNPFPEVQYVGFYFEYSWYSWTSKTSIFKRMTAASAHSARDTRLPAGEDHRLRFVEPLDSADRAALQASAGSPAYIADVDARKQVVFIAGNVLRTLVLASRMLPHVNSTKADLKAVWQKVWLSMALDCMSWLESLNSDARVKAGRSAMDVISGKVSWHTATVIYDTGIVYRTRASSFVQPVSAMASAVVINVLASEISKTRVHLSTLSDGRKRGFELEHQVLASLDVFDKSFVCKRLDNSSTSVSLQSHYSLPFINLEEVVPRADPVLYRPVSLTYACDAILMPADDDERGKICLVECSTTSPLLADRIDKVIAWFKPDGVASVLRRTFPHIPLSVLLCYDGELKKKPVMSADVIALSKGELQPLAPHPSPPATPASDVHTVMEASLEGRATPPAAAVVGSKKEMKQKEKHKHKQLKQRQKEEQKEMKRRQTMEQERRQQEKGHSQMKQKETEGVNEQNQLNQKHEEEQKQMKQKHKEEQNQAQAVAGDVVKVVDRTVLLTALNVLV